ncbi:MAG: GNAT family N-acetyltransferase [Candidatus Eremiobacteraeota bacterium]|nr:GNAT family N-acetyltransferase [Candidatus Eremiobacteraeota bacterium]
MASRVFIRFAIPRDAERLVSEGILSGPPPPGHTWVDRARLWLAEQQGNRRLILIAEDDKGILGTVQVVFRLPEGYNDPETANGIDVAMMEMLRTRKGAPAQVAERLIDEIQQIARKRNIKTLTFCISMDQPRAIAQVKAWGFEEFRIMPEKRGMLAFFRKAVP